VLKCDSIAVLSFSEKTKREEPREKKKIFSNSPLVFWFWFLIFFIRIYKIIKKKNNYIIENLRFLG